MQTINNDIKNQTFRPMYLIYGEENYLKRFYKNKLVEAMVGDDTMNFNEYAGKGIEIRPLIDLAETMPFFAERRVILIEDSELFKKKDEELADYLKSMPETTCMIFVEQEVDKRNKLFKTVKELGYVCECAKQNEAYLERWVLQRLKREEKKITRDTLNLIFERIGDDMELLECELEKLFSYTAGKDVIETEDVLEICTVRLEAKIFDMMDAISEKNRERILELYYDLVALREPPMRILFMLVRQFRLLMQVKQLSDKGLRADAIAAKIGSQSFVVRKTLRQVQNFTLAQLKEALRNCMEMEEAVKSGRMDENMALELLLIQYSSK
ncbi:MAG: DNA polymerase III subunit delta [Lachnospiraceae bacterium]|nr:DNA polymerase III subunit delta [Lachnospiraceae bacterium]